MTEPQPKFQSSAIVHLARLLPSHQAARPMISASRRLRRGRDPSRQNASADGAQQPLAQLACQCRKALEGAACSLAAARAEAGSLLARSVADAVQRLELAWAAPRRPQLLASVTNSALEGAAVLPSKNRVRAAGLAASSADGTAPDAEDQLDERILISEVDIVGVEGELKDVARKALTIRPNYTYTSKEVEEDIKRIFDTGYFHHVEPHPEDTRDGVKLTVEVSANPVLRNLSAVGANVLPQLVVQDAFRNMYGRTLNYNQLSAAVKKLTDWYEANGVLGQVIDVYTLSGEGSVEVRVAEAMVNRIQLKYLDRQTGEARDEGKTRPEIILRNLTTRPGQVYNLHQAKKDVESVYGLGIFEDVSIRPMQAPGSTLEDPHVDLELEVKEKKTRGLSVAGGVSQSGAVEGMMPGFVGRLAFADRNLFGLGQKLVAEVDLGQGSHQADMTFRVAHTDPWVRGDQYHTSRTASIDYSKTSTAVIHGKAPDDEAADTSAGAAVSAAARGALGLGPAGGSEEGVYVQRTVAKVEWGRPLGTGWHGNLGVTWQQAKCVDDHGEPLLQDHYGSQMAFSEAGKDTLATIPLRVAYNSGDGRSHLSAGVEQSVPIGQGYLNFNRITGRVERELPLGPASVWVCSKGGVIIGDLPPYEAFPIGGTNSVRGYAEGAVGTGRRHVTASAELRVPLVKPIEGTLFVDGGTDLDSGATVPGDPAGRRQKPGKGYGAGAGVRIDTPLGPVRLECAWNDRGQRRFHLGIGHG